ncbi:alpha/beta fold hydrolase [Planomonospora sp. ID67723]|uniref:alpha/beta fold hydrolase n=1 Tax=Planomonospora sp. ID67723 TaxID=2738134 RepID=UPI0018C44CE5|nr:alpha/beta fold hydrolase [Planomonospora sp. ID67723]MBG0828249.1 alpha/beta fold hydrolase [Planomonospora sp. ID67723]
MTSLPERTAGARERKAPGSGSTDPVHDGENDRRPTPGGRRLKRRLIRGVAAALALLMAVMLYGAYGYMPAEEGRSFSSPFLREAGSRFADTPLARFHYIRAGSGSPVVLLSPGAGSVVGWKEQVRALAGRHTVYVVDLPGQGYTRLHDRAFTWDLDGMTRAVGVFMDAVGLRRAALAGNSWSGGWALAFAQRHPGRVSKLALLDATGLDLPGTWQWEALKIPVLGELAIKFSTGKPTVRTTMEAMMANRERVTDELVDEWWAPMTFHDNLRATYLLERGLDWSRTERAMPDTRIPTLVVWGRQDTVQPVERAQRFADLLPEARLHVLEGCGHLPQLDCPEPVNRLLGAFFGDV